MLNIEQNIRPNNSQSGDNRTLLIVEIHILTLFCMLYFRSRNDRFCQTRKLCCLQAHFEDIRHAPLNRFLKEAVGIHVLLRRSLFGDGILRRLLPRVSLAKPTSAPLPF